MNFAKLLANEIFETEQFVREDIDEELWETLYILNSKGYETYSCCSGHGVKDGYISFLSDITFSIPTCCMRVNKMMIWDSRKVDVDVITKWALGLPVVDKKKDNTYVINTYNKKGNKRFAGQFKDYEGVSNWLDNNKFYEVRIGKYEKL